MGLYLSWSSILFQALPRMNPLEPVVFGRKEEEEEEEKEEEEERCLGGL